MPKKTNRGPIEEEREAEEQSEVIARRQVEPSAEEVAVAPDEEAEAAIAWAEATDTNQEVPAEVASVHETKKGLTVSKKLQPIDKKGKVGVKARRSAKYRAAKSQLAPGKMYSLEEAIALVKKLSTTKFDAAVEVHLKLLRKKDKTASESPKGNFHLPHGTGKARKIVVLDSEKIEKIAKTKKIDFDVAIATPKMMSEVAKIAKILGPKGKMPDPKLGTVAEKPEEAVESIKKGRVEYRLDASNNVHQIIGRVSWDETKLCDNARAIFKTLPKSRVEKAYICSSMSPSVALDLTDL